MYRNYTYRILIDFDNNFEEKILLDTKVHYPLSHSYEDDFLIKSNKIFIEAKRSSSIKMESIFRNYNSTIYRQIIKSLAYYYCSSEHPSKIKQLKITRLYNNKEKASLVKDHKEINQIIENTGGVKILKKINPDQLKSIFLESNRGHNLLFSLSHLIRATSLTNTFEKFDKLWRSFNAIYKELANSTSDSSCLVFLSNHMRDNPNLYPLSTTQVSSLTSIELRDQIRWRAMILNDFKASKDTARLKLFITRLTDHRLLTVINELLPIRSEYLITNGVYTEVTEHINNNLKLNIKSDIQIVSLICLRYMYYIRNKNFHAEKIDSSFQIISDNKEETSLKWCNAILEKLLVDIINFNTSFSPP